MRLWGRRGIPSIPCSGERQVGVLQRAGVGLLLYRGHGPPGFLGKNTGIPGPEGAGDFRRCQGNLSRGLCHLQQPGVRSGEHQLEPLAGLWFHGGGCSGGTDATDPQQCKAPAGRRPGAGANGPVERGDAETVRKHLSALGDGPEAALYRAASEVLVSIAECKNPDREYAGLRRILE